MNSMRHTTISSSSSHLRRAAIIFSTFAMLSCPKVTVTTQEIGNGTSIVHITRSDGWAGTTVTTAYEAEKASIESKCKPTKAQMQKLRSVLFKIMYLWNAPSSSTSLEAQKLLISLETTFRNKDTEAWKNTCVSATLFIREHQEE